MSDELKKCPFCGAKPQYRSISFSAGLVRVCCSICAASTDYYPNNDYPSAEKKWNTRPIEDALVSEHANFIKGMQYACDQMRVERDAARKHYMQEVDLLATEQEEHAKTRAEVERLTDLLSVMTLQANMYHELYQQICFPLKNRKPPFITSGLI